MGHRMNFAEHAPELYKALQAAERALRQGPLNATVRELIKIRGSQLNGCLFCVDMHVHEALELGETLDRIVQLPVWRESRLYTSEERAALGYTDVATRAPEGGVPDEVWDEAALYYKPDELAALVGQVAIINAWNRIAAPTHAQPPVRD